MVFVFVIFLLLWGGLHVYIAERLLSIPVIAQYLPPHILVPVMVFLGVSYIASRVMEHYELLAGCRMFSNMSVRRGWASSSLFSLRFLRRMW